MLDLHDFQLYLMRLERSENTIASYLRDVTVFLQWYDDDPKTIHEMTLIDYKRHLNQREKSVITANRKLASVNAFCGYLCDVRVLPEAYAVKLTKNRDKPEYKGVPMAALHTLYETIRASGNTLHICIIELLLATGIRVSELTGLTLSDINLGENSSIRVRGKGSVYRTLPLNAVATAALAEYLIVRVNAGTDRLLVGQRGPLGRGAVEIILSNYGNAMGIKVTPHDYVCVLYKNNYRSNANFISANCLGMDCDNDHSENPEDWVTLESVRQAFPGVTFAVHYSRNHMKPKKEKSARPKFHCLFQIDEITDPSEYSDLKKRVNSIFPFFDPNALDAARFFFGTKSPEVVFYPGTITLNEYLDRYHPDAGYNLTTDTAPPPPAQSLKIPKGSRNNTISSTFPLPLRIVFESSMATLLDI